MWSLLRRLTLTSGCVHPYAAVSVNIAQQYDTLVAPVNRDGRDELLGYYRDAEAASGVGALFFLCRWSAFSATAASLRPSFEGRGARICQLTLGPAAANSCR
jgi:hypothetical protein